MVEGRYYTIESYKELSTQYGQSIALTLRDTCDWYKDLTNEQFQIFLPKRFYEGIIYGARNIPKAHELTTYVIANTGKTDFSNGVFHYEMDFSMHTNMTKEEKAFYQAHQEACMEPP